MAKAAKKTAVRPRRRERKNVVDGQAHIHATFNNTIITITDKSGNAISWASAGMNNKGSRKGTAYAAQVASEEAGKKAVDHGMKTVEVFVKGPGSGREPADRALEEGGLQVTLIKYVPPVPRNGCRPPKRRRV